MTATLLDPAQVLFLHRRRGAHRSRIVDVEAGQYSSFAVTSEGRVEAWGLNNYGQLGIQGGPLSLHSPAAVTALAHSRVALLAGGTHHSLAVTEEGKTLAWGRSTYGGLGRAAADSKSDTASPQPQEVDNMGGCNVIAISAGANVSAAVDDKGRLHTWGFGDMQQLGTGRDSDAVSPVIVPTAGRLAGFKVLQTVLGGQHASLLAVESDEAPPPPSDAAALAAAEVEDSDDGNVSADDQDGSPEDVKGVISNGVKSVPDPWAQATAAGSLTTTTNGSNTHSAPGADDAWARLAAASQTVRPISDYLDDEGPNIKKPQQPHSAPAKTNGPEGTAAAVPTTPAPSFVFGVTPSATTTGVSVGDPKPSAQGAAAAAVAPPFVFGNTPAATAKDSGSAGAVTSGSFSFGRQTGGC